MSYQTRAINIINEILGTVPGNGRYVRIADSFVKHRPDLVNLYAVDPSNPTNEESAKVFVEAAREWGKSIVGNQAEKDEADTVKAQVMDAGNTARQDFG